jgi:hypothetical protein
MTSSFWRVLIWLLRRDPVEWCGALVCFLCLWACAILPGLYHS